MATTRRRLLGLTMATPLVAAVGPLLAERMSIAQAYDDFTSDPSAAGRASRFTIAVVPDTQFYARYSDPLVADKYTPRWGSEPWAVQSHWIVENAKKYNIAFTTHLGDLVDQSDKAGQWMQADKDMKILEDGGMPYSVLAGNHDFGHAEYEGRTYDYLSTFPPERAARVPTFQGRSPSGMAEYHVFTAQGQRFGVLALSFQDVDDFGWAKKTLAANPTIPTIVTSHQVLDIAADGSPVHTEFGEKLWKEVVSPNDQVFMTIGGHHHGATHEIRRNAAGHDVIQVLMDYQMDFAGGNGDMGLIEIDLTHGRITGTAFSPWVLVKPRKSLNAEFDMGLLESHGATYTEALAFSPARFPGIVTDRADQRSLTVALRKDIAAQYTNPQHVEPTPPSGPEDYPHVEGTVAHWRVDPARIVDGRTLSDGEVIPVGGRIVDLVEGADFLRQKPGAFEDTGRLGDVTFRADHARLSSCAGSVCFANADRDTNRVSWFETAVGKAVDVETFPNGYTFETFIRIDPSFTADRNRWMVGVGRSGTRDVIKKDHAPHANIEDGEPPVALAISSLREVQWSFMGVSGASEGWQDGSAWSGDVDPDRWLHIAVTNDPQTHETTVNVNGVPMLRSVSGLAGLEAMAKASATWTLGGDHLVPGRAKHGWLGSIGETRIVDHVIGSDQWLTARRKGASPTPEHPSSGSSSSTGTTGGAVGDGGQGRPTGLPRTGN